MTGAREITVSIQDNNVFVQPNWLTDTVEQHTIAGAFVVVLGTPRGSIIWYTPELAQRPHACYIALPSHDTNGRALEARDVLHRVAEELRRRDHGAVVIEL